MRLFTVAANFWCLPITDPVYIVKQKLTLVEPLQSAHVQTKPVNIKIFNIRRFFLHRKQLLAENICFILWKVIDLFRQEMKWVASCKMRGQMMNGPGKLGGGDPIGVVDGLCTSLNYWSNKLMILYWNNLGGGGGNFCCFHGWTYP